MTEYIYSSDKIVARLVSRMSSTVMLSSFAVILSLAASSCTQPATCIYIVQNDGKVTFQSELRGGGGPKISAPIPGRLVAFRKTQLWGAGVVSTGEGGKIYRIDPQFKLEPVAEFDTVLSDQQILSRFGAECRDPE